MRTVELIPGIVSSALGFGCAPILGSVDKVTARRALGVALDEGVTHFDVARSYGYGEAESFVGRYLGPHRRKVVLATKFGIVVTPLARIFSPIKPLVRRLIKMKVRPVQTGTGAKPGVAIGDLFHRRVPMIPEGLQSSVESSLRMLRTDYLDYIFLHEPSDMIEGIDALVEAVIRLKSDGKIRAWGLAFMRDREGQHTAYLKHFDVLQYNLSPAAKDYESVRRHRASNANVLFSPFHGVPVGPGRDRVLSQLGSDFPNSVILCSMFNPDHIRANARCF